MTDSQPKSAIARAGESWTDERADEMRAIGEDQRRAAIDAAPNCLGYDRFSHRRRQVDMREKYRKPQAPAPGGKA